MSAVSNRINRNCPRNVADDILMRPDQDNADVIGINTDIYSAPMEEWKLASRVIDRFENFDN